MKPSRAVLALALVAPAAAGAAEKMKPAEVVAHHLDACFNNRILPCCTGGHGKPLSRQSHFQQVQQAFIVIDYQDLFFFHMLLIAQVRTPAREQAHSRTADESV